MTTAAMKEAMVANDRVIIRAGLGAAPQF